MRIRNKPKNPVRKVIKDTFWIDFSSSIPLDNIREHLLVADEVQS